jgi:Protein of unknown function (DUF3309)
MSILGLIVLIVLVLLLMGGLPTWNHSRSWGYGPSGGLGLVLVIVLVLNDSPQSRKCIMRPLVLDIPNLRP